jgi:hypothetical protein
VPEECKEAVDRVFKNYIFSTKTFRMSSDLFINTYDSNFPANGPVLQPHNKSPIRDPASAKDTEAKAHGDRSPDKTYAEIYTRKHIVHKQIQENEIKLLQNIHSIRSKIKQRTPSRVHSRKH